MAEERLIDDDKDRKYKIRVNEDGEEELIIDDSPEEEETEEIGFEVPELEEDDEEAAVMTPEQLAARDRAREEAEENRIKGIAERKAHAGELIAAGKYTDALYVLGEAEALGKDGGVYSLKAFAMTKNFTDFSCGAECLPAAEGVKELASEEEKAEFLPYAESVKKAGAELRAEVERLGVENEEKKAERGAAFAAKKKKYFIAFGVISSVLVIFAVLAGYFGANMHANLSNTNMILCFTFIGLLAVTFIAYLFVCHKLWDAARLLKLNSKNSSTKLGREYEAKKSELNLIENLLAAYGLPL
ncbi:MAG: hypothetical protein NC489_39200 [Ruminococcus flavefaciens]|nr:hypothetical protein [Ruminococcus flavefaciens]